MADGKDPTLVKQTLDKDLVKIGRAEAAVQATARSVVGPGLAFLFLAAIVVVGGALLGGQDNGLLIIAAAAIGGAGENLTVTLIFGLKMAVFGSTRA